MINGLVEHIVTVEESTSIEWVKTIPVLMQQGRIAQSEGHLTRKSEVLGLIHSLATYFRFSFR